MTRGSSSMVGVRGDNGSSSALSSPSAEKKTVSGIPQRSPHWEASRQKARSQFQLPHRKVFTHRVPSSSGLRGTSDLNNVSLNSPPGFPLAVKQEHASGHHFFFLPRKTHEPVAANQTGLSPGADTSAIHRRVFSASTTQGYVSRCWILKSLSTIGVPQDTAAEQCWLFHAEQGTKATVSQRSLLYWLAQAISLPLLPLFSAYPKYFSINRMILYLKTFQ